MVTKEMRNFVTADGGSSSMNPKPQEHANTVFCCTFGQVESSRGSVLDLATASYDGTCPSEPHSGLRGDFAGYEGFFFARF